MVCREEQRHVHRNTGCDALLDRGQAFGGPRDLDEEVVALGLRMQFRGRPHGALGVVGEKRRDFERNPAVDPIGALVDRREEVGGTTQVLDRELEEERFAVHPGRGLLLDRVVVGARGDRLVEDRGVRRQPGHRVVVDVRLELPGVEHLPCDVVEPEALAQLVQLLGRFHLASFLSICAPARNPLARIPGARP